jgi:hypothetical protein
MRLLTTLVALVWIAAVAWYGWISLPQLPLDVSATDPATLEALNAARMQHGLFFAAVAFLPAIAIVAIGRWLMRAG